MGIHFYCMIIIVNSFLFITCINKWTALFSFDFMYEFRTRCFSSHNLLHYLTLVFDISAPLFYDSIEAFVFTRSTLFFEFNRQLHKPR